MSSILTIFFCGTGATSNDINNNNPEFHNGELVPTLYQNCTGLPYIGKLIFDGPGSGNLREHEKWIESDDRYDLNGKLAGAGWENNVKAAVTVALAHVEKLPFITTDKKINKNSKPHWIADKERQKCGGCKISFSMFTRKHHCRKCGEIFCSACLPMETFIDREITEKYTSYNEASYKVLKSGKGKICNYCFSFWSNEITALRAEIYDYRKIHKLKVINVIGWSRGGVSCIMFANACAATEGLKDIPINIFTIDPVPGYGNMDEHRCNLNSNVKNYASIIQMDEVSRGFSPVIPKTDKMTNCFYFAMPGKHGTGVGNANLDGKDGTNNIHPNPLFLSVKEPGFVTRHLVEIYLTKFDTILDAKLDLDNDQILRYYDMMLKKEIEFKRMHKTVYVLLAQGNFFGPKVRDVYEEGKYKPITEIKRLQSGFFINSHHQLTVYSRFPCLENIWSREVISKNPKNEDDIMIFWQELCNKLEIIPRFEQDAPGLFGCILETATKHWETMLSINNIVKNFG